MAAESGTLTLLLLRGPETLELELKILQQGDLQERCCENYCAVMKDLLNSEIQNLRLELKAKERELETRLQV